MDLVHCRNDDSQRTGSALDFLGSGLVVNVGRDGFLFLTVIVNTVSLTASLALEGPGWLAVVESVMEEPWLAFTFAIEVIVTRFMGKSVLNFRACFQVFPDTRDTAQCAQESLFGATSGSNSGHICHGILKMYKCTTLLWWNTTGNFEKNLPGIKMTKSNREKYHEVPRAYSICNIRLQFLAITTVV